MKIRSVPLVLIVALLFGVAGGGLILAGPPKALKQNLSYQLMPVSAVVDSCQSLTWTTSSRPADYTHWVDATMAHRSGHFWSSRDCGGMFAAWARGQAYDSDACTRYRVIVYNSRHHWDYATGWRTACNSTGIPAVIDIPRGREISFECQDTRPAQRRPNLHCLYNPVRF